LQWCIQRPLGIIDIIPLLVFNVALAILDFVNSDNTTTSHSYTSAATTISSRY
jgi:hypothetical protein